MLIIAPDVFRQQGHLRNRKHVVVVVVGAKSDCAARLSQGGEGALTPRFAAMAAWCEMMVPESPSNAISVSSTYRGDTLGEAFTVPRPEFRGWVSPQGFYSDSPPGRAWPKQSAGIGWPWSRGPYVNEAASTTDVSI